MKRLDDLHPRHLLPALLAHLQQGHQQILAAATPVIVAQRAHARIAHRGTASSAARISGPAPGDAAACAGGKTGTVPRLRRSTAADAGHQEASLLSFKSAHAAVPTEGLGPRLSKGAATEARVSGSSGSARSRAATATSERTVCGAAGAGMDTAGVSSPAAAAAPARAPTAIGSGDHYQHADVQGSRVPQATEELGPPGASSCTRPYDDPLTVDETAIGGAGGSCSHVDSTVATTLSRQGMGPAAQPHSLPAFLTKAGCGAEVGCEVVEVRSRDGVVACVGSSWAAQHQDL